MNRTLIVGVSLTLQLLRVFSAGETIVSSASGPYENMNNLLS